SGSVLMIASDHGFRWKEGRPSQLSSAAAATAGRWHRDEGIYLIRGPGVQASPDVLANYRDHWRPSAPVRTDPKANQEEIEKLKSLGYIGSGSTEKPPESGGTRTAASYNNEGLLRRERGETTAALTAFEKALALEGNNASALWNLSDLLHSQQRDLDRSDDLLVRALAAGLPEGVDYAAARAVLYTKSGEAERGLRLLDRTLEAKPADPRLHLLRGSYHLERHHCQQALADFEAATADPRSALAQSSAGIARLCLNDSAGAARNFRRSLEIDPNQPEIRRALGELP